MLRTRQSNRLLRPVACAILCIAAVLPVWSDGDSPAFVFEKHVIDPDFANGYQVSTADLDRDGDLDVIALSTQPSQLVWYRNPDWARFSISTATQRNIDAAPNDIDGDGDADLAVASDFDLGDSRNGGTIQWLENPGNPAGNPEWVMHPIDAIPTSHRVRWADIDGDGKKELLNLPIIGVGATPPEYAVGLQFRAYRPPADPTAPWTSILLDDTLCMAHGLLIAPWDEGGRAAIFTASFDGVHRYTWKSGIAEKTQIGVGHAGIRPAQGASEVGLGHRTKGELRFIATIEPGHGNEVVVYSGRDGDPLPWPRMIIDESLVDGHALVCLDVDRDGTDEIIAGGRGGSHEVLLFRWSGTGWQRQVIDAVGVAMAGLTVGDVNGDGSPDLVATGTATHDVVWYESRGAQVDSSRN